MTDIPAGAAVRWRGEIIALQIVVAIFLGLRLYANLNAGLLGDEAYYWMWGQRLAWSYFDHPPLHAWLLGAVSAVSGWSRLSVRVLTWLTLAGVMTVFWDWSKRMAPKDPELWFWQVAAVYLASPIFFAVTTIAYHDHLLVFLVIFAAHCFLVFAQRFEGGDSGWRRWLYGASFVLGLAALTKYNAVFLGLGFATTFLVRPRLRTLLATPHPWLAALVALAIQAPVLWWNIAEGGASFHFHFVDRWVGMTGKVHWDGFTTFAILTLLFWSPFLVWPTIRVIRDRSVGAFTSVAKTLAVATFIISAVAMIFMSLVVVPFFYWSIVGFATMMPLIAGAMRSNWLRWAHLIYGLSWAGIAVVNYAVVPIGALIHRQDNGTSINYGWDIIAEHVRAAQSEEPTDLVGGARYAVTAQLGFALHTNEVVNLSPIPSQYDFWQVLPDLAGKSATLLIDDTDKAPIMAHLKSHFTALTEVDAFDISAAGTVIYRWRIFRGDGYLP